MKAQMLTAMAAATLVFAGAASAQDEKHFDGFYVGGELGHTLGDGPDDLYYSAAAGFRKQLDNNIVLGVEGTFGNVDLTAMDHVWTLNGTVGRAIGDGRSLIFAGAGYVEAKASIGNISVSDGDVNLLVGYERAIGSNLSVRVKADVYGFDTVVPSIGAAFRF